MVKISKAVLVFSPEMFYLVHMNKVHLLRYCNIYIFRSSTIYLNRR